MNLEVVNASLKSKIDQYVIARVKEKREALGISQKDLADELELSKGFIGKIENRKYPSHYNIKHLNKLARILQCSPQDFLPSKPI
ncbi:MAG TPA: helix-turn-helix transcriptional regulator [Puia sp.]|nr:helix-turn-helix transcriptional regulator [Puia sp.]